MSTCRSFLAPTLVVCVTMSFSVPTDVHAQDAAAAVQDASGGPPSATQHAAEQPSNGARELFDEGRRLSREQRYAEALECFQRARDIEERPIIVLNIALTLTSLARAIEATREVDRFLEIADVDDYRQEREEASRLKEELRDTILTVTLNVLPITAHVEVDGVEVAGSGAARTLRLDPGDHVVTVRAEGYATRTVDVAGRSEVDVELALETGTLIVTTNVSDSVIQVDGNEVGRAEIRTELTPGVYEVSASAPGHDDFQQSVQVEPGAQVRVVATLPRTPGIGRSPILWTVVGVVLVGAVVAVSVGVARRDRIDYGTTNTAVLGLTF